jgi:hypothetical protein
MAENSHLEGIQDSTGLKERGELTGNIAEGLRTTALKKLGRTDSLMVAAIFCQVIFSLRTR